MRKIFGVMALGAALVVAGSMSAWADSQEVQEMLQKMQQRIDELEGQVNQLREGSAGGGEGAGASVSYSPVDNIDLLVNFDYGQATDVLAVASGDSDAEWIGLSGIVALGGGLPNPTWEDWSLAPRGEWFSDEDGYRTGIAQDLWEVTGTLKRQMSEHLQARLEYRHDESNRSLFEKDSRFQKGQDTMILEFAYLM